MPELQRPPMDRARINLARLEGVIFGISGDYPEARAAAMTWAKQLREALDELDPQP